MSRGDLDPKDWDFRRWRRQRGTCTNAVGQRIARDTRRRRHIGCEQSGCRERARSWWSDRDPLFFGRSVDRPAIGCPCTARRKREL